MPRAIALRRVRRLEREAPKCARPAAAAGAPGCVLYMASVALTRSQRDGGTESASSLRAEAPATIGRRWGSFRVPSPFLRSVVLLAQRHWAFSALSGVWGRVPQQAVRRYACHSELSLNIGRVAYWHPDAMDNPIVDNMVDSSDVEADAAAVDVGSLLAPLHSLVRGTKISPLPPLPSFPLRQRREGRPATSEGRARESTATTDAIA